MRWLNGPGVQLGLDNELSAADGVWVVGDAVDASVTGCLVELGVIAHGGEQVLDELLELLGAEFEEVGPPVEVGDDIDRVDDARVRHAVGHDGLDGYQLVWVLRDVGEEVPAYALHGFELRLVQDERAELFPCSAKCDEVRLDLLARDRVNCADASIEDDRADHLVWGRGEDLTERSKCDLGDDALVDQPDLCWLPGCRFYSFAGLDVPECLLTWDHADWGQVPLHGKKRRFGHVACAALCWEVRWVGRLLRLSGMSQVNVASLLAGIALAAFQLVVAVLQLNRMLPLSPEMPRIPGAWRSVYDDEDDDWYDDDDEDLVEPDHDQQTRAVIARLQRLQQEAADLETAARSTT